MELDPELAAQLKRVLTSLEQLLPKPVARIDWSVSHAANWRRHSFSGYLEPIDTIESIHLDDLPGIDKQKRSVEENTRQFLAGFPANNILLWGTRGTGKSSLVRALLHSYAPQGLRVIQVDKDDLVHLPDIVDEIKDEPYKYIIFSDDLSFAKIFYSVYGTEGDPLFKGQCHCRECQYISGGHPNVVMGMPESGFSYAKGKPKAFRRSDLANGPVADRRGSHRWEDGRDRDHPPNRRPIAGRSETRPRHAGRHRALAIHDAAPAET